jgi:hypothetical protein
MQKSKLLLGLVIVFTVTFFSLQIFDLGLASGVVRGLVLPTLIYLYCITSKERSSFFFWFLMCYAIAELFGAFSYFAFQYDWFDNLSYFGGNLMYISAYFFLTLEIIKSMNLKEVFSRYAFPFIILLALDIWCVILVTEMSYGSERFTQELPDLILEVIYNIVVMLLLTFALLNYMSKHSKKAMNLLIGSICFVVSEVTQVAYFYVNIDRNILAVSYTFMLIAAFTFLYIQSRMDYLESEDIKHIQQVSA